MTQKFKDLISAHRQSMIAPSVKLKLEGSEHVLFLRFDTKDILREASYLGPIDIWLASLCELITGKNVQELRTLSFKAWDNAFLADQMFQDLKLEISDQVFFKPLEMLKAALSLYLGEEHYYKPSSPLVCRCFGVRENDLKAYFHDSTDPSLEDLAKKLKATSGCRSCLTQINKFFLQNSDKKDRYYKEKSKADWIVEIDYMLSCFPEAKDWKMQIKEFKQGQVVITYQFEATQKEVEALNIKLQDFLGASVDPDLAFFLFRN